MGLLCLELLGAGWGQTMALCPLGQGVEQDGRPQTQASRRGQILPWACSFRRPDPSSHDPA